MMEVKINREIRNYKESIFFGLSLRQFFFSACAVGATLILYFLFSPIFNKELVSWICIVGALPFAGLGFFKYNGMPLEKFIVVWLKSELLVPKELKFVAENIYFEAIKPNLENKKKEELKK